LGKVHAIGVVHRDLKPENLILIERDGREDFVKLIDFGIAQIGHQGAGVFGTAAYMAPEQAASGATVDRRADVYSLGVILFEMVTGRHPFPSQTDSAYLIAHADTKVPRPSKLSSRCPPALEAVILRCMEKNPDARYASADQVAAALRVIDSRATSGGRAGVIAAGLVLAAGAGVAAFLVLPQYLENRKASAASNVVETARAEPIDPAPAPPEPAAAVDESPEPAVAAKLAEAPTQDEPAAAASATVDIGIVTVPEGVTVYRMGETVALGVTPFTVPLPRSAKPLEVRFEKPGYQAKTIEVPVDAPLEIEVSLTKQRDSVATTQTVKIRKTAPPAGAVSPPKKVQREGVMDPFANP
jgi:serine/threonine-protein kinase